MSMLLIRADAGAEIGSGHIMRCLALAQAWRDQCGPVTFACAQLGDVLNKRLVEEGMSIQYLDAASGSQADAHQTIALANNITASTIVLDGYCFKDEYQNLIKKADFELLLIDDNGASPRYYADWILNQNLHATDDLYQGREPYTSLLLGSKYVMLRREFWSWRGWRRLEIPNIALNMLITMGGADPDNVTGKFLNALLPSLVEKGIQIKTIVGANNPSLSQLKAVASQTSSQIEILHNVTSMPELMSWADMCISAAGSTVWELCFMGLPSAVVVIADNQKAAANQLSVMTGVPLLDYAAESNDLLLQIESLRKNRQLRENIYTNMISLVDGYGVDRVLRRIKR